MQLTDNRRSTPPPKASTPPNPDSAAGRDGDRTPDHHSDRVGVVLGAGVDVIVESVRRYLKRSG